jgi:hypothetical protein
VEYWSPKYNYYSGTYYAARGASGVFMKGSYNVVIVDTFGLSAADYNSEELEAFCGAIYYISAPLVFSACKPGGEWNAYDIEFRDQVCTNGVKTKDAEFVEVKLNGILVQQHVAAPHVTLAGMTDTCEPRGVMLQDSGFTLVPVSFRNIWAIPRN